MTTPDCRVLRRDQRGLAFTLGVVLFLAASVDPAGADGPVITEFMAVNQTTLADQDGAYSPWVEIRNLSLNSTNLLGWTLTDNTNSPAKWVFPGMELAPGQCIVVFASGENRAISGQELHTNFRLSSSGGYLGLRHPSGSIASEWVSYPPQAPDLSYGSFLYVTESQPLVTNGASVSYFVPVAGAPPGWTNEQFNAAQWPAGPTPIGFDIAGSFGSYSNLILAERPRYYWNFDEGSGAVINWVNPTNSMDWLWPQATATRVAQVKPGLGNAARLDGKAGTRFLAANLAATAELQPPWAVECWLRCSTNSQVSYLLEGQSEGGSPNRPGLLYGYNSGRLEIYGSMGRSGASGVIVDDTNWHHVVFAVLGSAAGDGLANVHQIYLDGRLSLSLSNSFSAPLPFGAGGLAVGATRVEGSFFNGDIDELAVHDLSSSPDFASGSARLAVLASNHWSAVVTTNYGGGIATDLRSTMANRAMNLFLRYPVVVTNLGGLNALKLRANYNDGFAAWLNGHRVLSVNAPADVGWRTPALTNRLPVQAMDAADLDLSTQMGLLHAGTNSLAIQALNSSLNSPEFLFASELLLQAGVTGTGYLRPSPATANPALEHLSRGPLVLMEPKEQSVSIGGDAIFSVYAVGLGVLRYQWFLNGSPIFGATNLAYSLGNVAPESQGTYNVRVSDATGEVFSEGAALLVHMPLTIAGQPQNLTVVPGQSANFLVSLNPGIALPVRYQWYKDNSLIRDCPSSQTADRLALGPVTLANAGVYTVLVSNIESATSSVPARLTVFADADGDRVADDWMVQHFGHPTGLLADRSRPQDDADADGSSNSNEFLAGTDPLDVTSTLKLHPVGLPYACMLNFQAISNHTYTLQTAGELAPRDGWQSLQDIAAHPTNRTVAISVPKGASNQFYRLVSPALGRRLFIAASRDNDVYQMLLASGANVARYDSAPGAVAAASFGDGVMVLANDYPSQKTSLDGALFQTARQKQVRLYVEYPGFLPGFAVPAVQTALWERGVVTPSGFLAPGLQAGRILSPHSCVFLPFSAPSPHLVLARVAGYDHTVYGLPPTTYPLLFEVAPGPQNGSVLVASTKLSQVTTARYEPAPSWQSVWRSILAWVSPETEVELTWQPTVAPAYARTANLPADAERQALQLGINWFNRSRLLVHPSRTNAISQAAAGSGLLPAPPPDSPSGDGSLGILEGYLSRIQPDGSQLQSVAIRGDCVTESAMALAFGGYTLGNTQDSATAARLLDYWYFVSPGCKGERADTNHASFGLSAWGISSYAWYKGNYGDDNARVMLATMAAAAALNEDRWDEKLLLGLLANLRTSGIYGFRGDRIDQEELTANGWEYYFRRSFISYAPHFESYLWACYLWAYDKTGYPLFRDRAKTAITMTMQNYPGNWKWANGIQQERARMLLALAWLIRVEDTAEHRAWLRKVTEDLLLYQDASGAIAERLGALNMGATRPPASNEEYGLYEAPLLQGNGDPVSDMLYACNFALLGLHEAAAATGDLYYSQAADRLAAFLCRAQVRSAEHPELDGAWFRAFDFGLWGYWASNADAGWGAWCVETGWSQSWITSVLALRKVPTSLWDLTAQSKVNRFMDRWQPFMIPD